MIIQTNEHRLDLNEFVAVITFDITAVKHYCGGCEHFANTIDNISTEGLILRSNEIGWLVPKIPIHKSGERLVMATLFYDLE